MRRPTTSLAVAVCLAAAIPTAGAHAAETWPAARLSGYIQADGELYDQASQDEVDPSTGAPLNQTRFLIRRARIHLDVDHGRMAGALEVDFNTVNGPSAGLIDAEVTVRARARDDTGRPWGDASIGLLRTPWGYEVLERDQDRFFLERSTVSRALFPGVFDLGVRARAGWRFVNVQIALMNGNPVGDRVFPVQDPNHAKDVVGRLGVSGTRRRVAFSAGLSGLSGVGFHKGTPETKDVLVWRDQNQDNIVQLSEIQVISGSAATPSQNFSRFALGADVAVTVAVPRLGMLVAFAEAMWASNLDRGVLPADPIASGRNLRERGWVLGVVQELGAHFAAGGRLDRYDPDADAFQAEAVAIVPVDARFTTWTGTAGWRWTGLDRITAEYQHTTNPLGRSPAGVPTTLGSDTFTIRGTDRVVNRWRNLALLVIGGLAGCQSVRADSALEAEMRVAQAQYIAGDLEAAAPSGGPAVVTLFNSLTAVQPGEIGKPLSGTLESGATAVALGLRGDSGYWIVVAGAPSLEAPDQPTFAATVSFSPDLPSGDLTLVSRAVDAQGLFGPPSTVPLVSAPPAPPSGTLVVSLRWDTESDLDLHVVTPDGVEIWSGNINSYRPPPPGTPADASAWQQGGILDFDSNAGCQIDGRRQENVVWQAAPPAGTYLVRVDTASLCGTPAARWNVQVLLAGTTIAARQGQSLPSDTRFSMGPGSGVLAASFDVPPP